MRYYLLSILLSVLLAACGRNNGPVCPKEFIGNWAGVEKTDIGMYPTLEVTDSTVAYDPGIGDTCRWFNSYHFVNDSLFLIYDEKDTNRCKVIELHDSILTIKGLLWYEDKEVSFVRQKKGYSRL